MKCQMCADRATRSFDINGRTVRACRGHAAEIENYAQSEGASIGVTRSPSRSRVVGDSSKETQAAQKAVLRFLHVERKLSQQAREDIAVKVVEELLRASRAGQTIRNVEAWAIDRAKK